MCDSDLNSSKVCHLCRELSKSGECFVCDEHVCERHVFLCESCKLPTCYSNDSPEVDGCHFSCDHCTRRLCKDCAAGKCIQCSDTICIVCEHYFYQVPPASSSCKEAADVTSSSYPIDFQLLHLCERCDEENRKVADLQAASVLCLVEEAFAASLRIE